MEDLCQEHQFKDQTIITITLQLAQITKSFFNEVWEIMTDRLAKLQRNHQIQIAAFVLMSNYFHLLILTPKEDINRIMYFFMKEVTLDIQRITGRINKIFSGCYKGSMISTYSYLVNVYKYIYINPKGGVEL